jgi:hypothetical protein
MEIFVFFRHFRWKFLTVLKFSDSIPYSKDGNLRRFEIFRLSSFSKVGNPRHLRLTYSCFSDFSDENFRFPIIFSFDLQYISTSLSGYIVTVKISLGKKDDEQTQAY